MQADIERQDEKTEGVIVVSGTQNCGLSWYIKNDRLVFDYNVYRDHQVVRSSRTVSTGKCNIGIKFLEKGRGGTFTLLIDGEECGSMDIPLALRIFSSTGIQVGENYLSAITDDYETPFKFTGKLKKVSFKVVDDNPTEEDLQNVFDADMAEQ